MRKQSTKYKEMYSSVSFERTDEDQKKGNILKLFLEERLSDSSLDEGKYKNCIMFSL